MAEKSYEHLKHKFFTLVCQEFFTTCPLHLLPNIQLRSPRCHSPNSLSSKELQICRVSKPLNPPVLKPTPSPRPHSPTKCKVWILAPIGIFSLFSGGIGKAPLRLRNFPKMWTWGMYVQIASTSSKWEVSTPWIKGSKANALTPGQQQHPLNHVSYRMQCYFTLHF